MSSKSDTTLFIKVLLIEDNPDDEFLVRESLAESKTCKFIVESAERLSIGLDILEREAFDVVLLDLSLPDSFGKETFRRVHTQMPNVPIIVLTGLEDELLGSELVKEGGQDYLVKGQVDTTVLTRCINYSIERKQTESVVRQLAEETGVLAEIGRIISSSLELEEVYQRFAQQVRKLISYDRIIINLVDSEEEWLYDAYIFGVDTNLQPREEVSLNGTYEKEIVDTNVGLILQDATIEELVERYPQQPSTMLSSLRSHLGVPLRSQDRVIGILQVSTARLNAYSQKDLDLLDRIGAQIAGAIANAQLYAQIKDAEAFLKQQAEDLMRSNNELEQFAYVASHDLQEPLRMVKSYVQFLAEDYQGKLDADADRYINYVVDGAGRMQTLIDDLLAFSRIGTQGKEFEPTDCMEILDQGLSDLKPIIDERKARVTWDKLPLIMADKTQFAQLLRNLIGNGIKYCKQEVPSVHVSAELIISDKDGAESKQNEGEKWLFSIQDNGIGIDPSHFERIFLMFQRLHHRTEYPGTGIGLAICQKIVERHGGRIWIDSKPDQGSIFYFTIPAIEIE